MTACENIVIIGCGRLGSVLANELSRLGSSTVGISVGITSASAPAGVLWTEMAAMFLGRLEFFTVVVGLAKLVRDVPALVSRERRTRPARTRQARARCRTLGGASSRTGVGTLLRDAGQ